MANMGEKAKKISGKKNKHNNMRRKETEVEIEG